MFKRSIAAGGLALLAGTCAAQSNVTIYGIVDVGIVKRNGGTANNPGAYSPPNTVSMQSSTMSRLGFRGSEDLGGGFSAQFDLMHMFHADTGTSFFPNNFFGGKSIVQLTHKDVGSLYLGRDFIPAWWPAMFVDPFIWDGVGQNSTNQWAGYLATQATRTNNAVGYKSPNWNGLTVQADFSPGEGTSGNDFGFNAQYRKGPLYAALGFDRVNGGPALPYAMGGNKMGSVSLMYDFGFIKPSFYFNKARVNQMDNKDWMLGATIPAPGGKVKMSYNRLDTELKTNKQQKLSLGYEYFFSKRTNLYFDTGYSKHEGKSNSSVFALGLKTTF